MQKFKCFFISLILFGCAHKIEPLCSQEVKHVEKINKDVSIETGLKTCERAPDPSYYIALIHPTKKGSERDIDTLESDLYQTCEDFLGTIYIDQNAVIGCCPEPAGQYDFTEERERVFFIRFDPKTFNFIDTEFQGFINGYNYKEKNPRACFNQHVELPGN